MVVEWLYPAKLQFWAGDTGQGIYQYFKWLAEELINLKRWFEVFLWTLLFTHLKNLFVIDINWNSNEINQLLMFTKKPTITFNGNLSSTLGDSKDIYTQKSCIQKKLSVTLAWPCWLLQILSSSMNRFQSSQVPVFTYETGWLCC